MARSWRGVALGGVIALVVPVSLLLLAVLLENGIVSSDLPHDPLLTLIAFSEVLLGPVGIVVAGWSAGVRTPFAWLVLLVVAVPLLAAVWFVSVLVFGGATGNPF